MMLPRTIFLLVFSSILIEKHVTTLETEGKTNKIVHIEPRLKPKCTVDQVLERSGANSNENVKIGIGRNRVARLQPSLPDVCDDGTIAATRCRDLDTNFYKNFRTIDGQCNNVENPLLGSSFSKLSRLLPAENEMFKKPTFFRKPTGRTLKEFGCGSQLPNSRRVSLEMLPDQDKKDAACSQMAIFFGQFVAHDISLSPEHKTEEDCCKDNGNKDGECYEIMLPPDDPFFGIKNHTCLHLTRSVPHCSSHTAGGEPAMEREQQNIVTSFADASHVYGSVDDHSKNIRTMVRGKLKVSEEDNLLPEDYVVGCKVPIAGEERALENPPLASLHALMVREHNRISDRIWYMADWTKYGNDKCENDACDELLYQNARRILIAEYQNILYSEWLPIMLGETRTNDFKLKVDENVQYNKSVDPSILASFSTAAFRFGHSMVDATFTKNNPITGENVKNVTISDTFFDPTEYEGTGMEMVLKGLPENLAQARDRFVTKQLTTRLFKDKDIVILEDSLNLGQDLNARNIARGRDHGIPSYGEFYASFGPTADTRRSMESWESVPKTFCKKTWKMLKNLYLHPKDVDLYTGGLLEKPIEGEGPLGYMFGYIIGEQFKRLKDGDRFFFTNEGHDHSFTTDAMNTIKKRRLSDLLCDNTLITSLGSNVFLTTSPKMNCGNCGEKNELNLEDINLLLPSTGEGSTTSTAFYSFGSSFGSFSSFSYSTTTTTTTTTSVSSTTTSTTTAQVWPSSTSEPIAQDQPQVQSSKGGSNDCSTCRAGSSGKCYKDRMDCTTLPWHLPNFCGGLTYEEAGRNGCAVCPELRKICGTSCNFCTGCTHDCNGKRSISEGDLQYVEIADTACKKAVGRTTAARTKIDCDKDPRCSGFMTSLANVGKICLGDFKQNENLVDAPGSKLFLKIH